MLIAGRSLIENDEIISIKSFGKQAHGGAFAISHPLFLAEVTGLEIIGSQVKSIRGRRCGQQQRIVCLISHENLLLY